ncbi:large conductance mechanosensitive channel protein, partial [mine drainage metagenome]
MRGNVLDMAVGIVMGSAFMSIIQSLVNDVIMPPIGFILGNVNFSNLYFTIKEGATPGPYGSLVLAKKAGAVTINYGLFINTIISFFIIATSVFFMVRSVNRLKSAALKPAPVSLEPTTKECPYCFSTISIKA